MRLLKKIVSAFLVACMVISMIPMAAVAAETGTDDLTNGRIILDQPTFGGYAKVWIDGIEYAVHERNGSCYVDLPDGAEASSMVTHNYHVGDSEDIHTH